MRLMLTWLLVLGVFAGLNHRVLAADHDHAVACEVDHGNSVHDGHSHDDEEPVDHHHHECCSQAFPATFAGHAPDALRGPAASYFGFFHEGVSPPDEPCLGSEKPPLI